VDARRRDGTARPRLARALPVMSSELSAQYERQERWRHWDEALARIPVKAGQRILDLGCGVGQIAARFHRLGAQVIGVDGNEELLEAARTRCPEVRFEKLDLGDLTPASFGRVDGVWAGFVAAYVPSVESAVARWSDCVVPGGWVTLVEMDDLFGHQPLPSSTSDKINEFYASARAAGRYDFQCGRRLAGATAQAGLTIIHEGTLPDDELSFQGPAPTDVLDAWRLRIQRMAGLKGFLGADFPEFERSFLRALAAPNHRSHTRVFIVVAQRPSGPGAADASPRAGPAGPPG
jgi:SAM-dependent methyltransferase